MTAIVLDKATPTIVSCGGKTYKLYEGDDGTLYIESGEGRLQLEIVVSDDDDAQVTAHGMWANIEVL